MTFVRQTLADFMKQQHIPASEKSLQIPVYSTCSEFKFELKSGTANLAGKMNLKDDYYNLALVDNNFDVVISATKPGLYTADVSALTSVKLTFSGNPEDIIYAFVE